MTNTFSAVPMPRDRDDAPTAVLHAVLQRLRETDPGAGHGTDCVEPVATQPTAPVAALAQRVRR